MSRQDIAKETGQPVSTTWLRRGLAQLKSCLNEGIGDACNAERGLYGKDIRTP
jgi:hypothetical protein